MGFKVQLELLVFHHSDELFGEFEVVNVIEPNGAVCILFLWYLGSRVSRKRCIGSMRWTIFWVWNDYLFSIGKMRCIQSFRMNCNCKHFQSWFHFERIPFSLSILSKILSDKSQSGSWSLARCTYSVYLLQSSPYLKQFSRHS